MRRKSKPKPKKRGRPRGRPFAPGDKRAGRPKGTPNKVTSEVRDLAQNLVEDPDYQTKLRSRLHSGKLAPHVETMLWHYAYGKPKEMVEISTPDGGPLAIIQNLTTAERIARLNALTAEAEGEADVDEPEAEDDGDGERAEDP